MNKNWIQKAIKHPGGLHKSLGVPMGMDIPNKKIDKAAHSDNEALRRKAQLAITLRKMHK